MKTSNASGPSATANWQRITVPASLESARPLTAVVLPDAANRAGSPDNLHYYLLAQPGLVRTAQGNPRLSLTLELSQAPTPGESTILPLVDRGWLTLTLTHGIDSDVREALEVATDSACRPLFARWMQLELVSGGKRLAATEGAGAEPPIALSAILDRDAALGVLAALDGAPTGLEVRTTVRYRPAPTTTSLRLQGRYTEIYDVLAGRVNADGLIDRATLLGILGEMLDERILVASRLEEADVPPRRWTDLETLLPRFTNAAAFILERREGGSFGLRRRPNPLMRLDVRETVASAGESRWVAKVKLEDILQGALDGLNRDEYLHLVTADAGGNTVPVPRLVRSRRMRGQSRGPGRRSVRLAAGPGAFMSLALAMTPDRGKAPSAHALLATDLVRTEGPRGRILGLADDFIIERLEGIERPRLLALPVVDRPDAPLWADRLNPDEYWYAPSWTPVMPAPGDDPASAAYRFTFERVGVTGGPNPTIGLDGTVRFTLQQTQAEATRAKLQEFGNPPARPVPLGNVSVSLDLPFRDGGEVRRQSFTADAIQDGERITATIALLNEWVRLCYGALAYEGFQEEPAFLRVAYAFRAYVPLSGDRLQLLFGGKLALTEVALESTRLPAHGIRPVFDPGRMALRLPHGVVRLEREAPRRGPFHLAAVAAVTATPAFTPLTAVVARPELAVAAELPEVTYGLQTIIRDERVEALFHCETLGAFYRQIEAGEETPVGCRETLRLGETVHRQFEEMVQLRDPLYRVHRSLQQPGRFLVVPSAYRITRFAATEPPDRAYRPAIMIYALLGADVADHRYFLRATLEPDLSPFTRRMLEERLKPLVQHQGRLIVDYPTDPTLQNPESPSTFRWKLPQDVEEPEVLQTWDGFQVSLSTGLVHALAVTTLIESAGLVGDVTFTLPDGRPLTSALIMDTNVIGPWEAGAVSVAISNARATLTNHTERAMNLFDLAVGSDTEPLRHVPVDLRLEPGGSTTVTLDHPAELGWASYQPETAELKLHQMNIFVEDVTTNVIFVNLINHANHGLTTIKVQCRLKGTPQQHVLDLGETATASITMTLPLTTYLEKKILEFQVIKTFVGQDQPTGTPWMEWDLERAGNVISLTWDVID